MKKPPSYQLPVRFDKESDAALEAVMQRIGETNASQVVRWAVLHYNRTVKFNVDRAGVPIDGKPPEDSPHPMPGLAQSARSVSR